MIFFLIFFIIPFIEIALFMGVGGEIGILKTLLLCFITAVIGGFLVRAQGLNTLMRGRSALADGELPIDHIFDGFCIVIAGALLLTPGFFTDCIGFSLLVPPVRKILKTYMSQRIDILRTNEVQEPRKRTPNDVVDGEFRRIDDPE